MSITQTVLQAQPRSGVGKGPARRLRETGLVPAVVYGRGSEPVPFSVDPAALKQAVATPHKLNTVITVKVEGQPDRLVLLKEVQQHPVTRSVLHADFQEVRLDRPLKVQVPVVLTGRAAGQADGGILTQVRRVLDVICLPGQIPENVPVDVTPLKIGQSLHESDVKLPEGLKLVSRKNETVAVVSAPAEEIVAPVAAAAAVPGAAPAEGAAAAPGAPGAAPAAPGAAGAAPAAGAKGAAPAAGKGAAPAAAAGKGAAPAAPAKPAGKK